MHKSTSNIAQDIMYTVSCPPNILVLGIAFTKQQSEKLVALFRAAGYTIGIDTIQRYETSIATDILNRYEENYNVYIPCIYALEETIDGENTFHCSQMMLWQRAQ